MRLIFFYRNILSFGMNLRLGLILFNLPVIGKVLVQLLQLFPFESCEQPQGETLLLDDADANWDYEENRKKKEELPWSRKK